MKSAIVGFVLVIILLGCRKDDSITFPHPGSPFAVGSPVKLFFRDQYKSDLLNLKDSEHYFPYSFDDGGPAIRIDSISKYYTPNDHDCIYNGESIAFDSTATRYAFDGLVFGREGIPSHEFYLTVTKTDIDTVKAYFHFTTGAMGGDGIYATATKLYYNGVLIFEGNQDGNYPIPFVYKKVFIEKNNGNTTITF